MSRKWLAFVVDTDTYAGNFERPMLAYVTGVKQDNFHDCDEKTADQVTDEFPEDVRAFFENNIGWGLDDGDDVPMIARCVIVPTPGWFNHGMGGHYKDGQEAEAFEDYKKECAKYKSQHPASSIEASPKLNKCPAYQSVAIFINDVPPPDMLKLMKDRATEFCKKPTSLGRPIPPLGLLGFRFVELHTNYVDRPA